jgi:hypothetical protein
MCKRSIPQKLSAAVYFIYRISFDTFLVEKMLNYECVTIYQKTTISYYAIKVLSMLCCYLFILQMYKWHSRPVVLAKTRERTWEF